jgi:hypothetical protein
LLGALLLSLLQIFFLIPFLPALTAPFIKHLQTDNSSACRSTAANTHSTFNRLPSLVYLHFLGRTALRDPRKIEASSPL